MNDRLQIAKEIYVKRCEQTNVHEPAQLALEVQFAITSADALIAAAGDGEPKPQPVETIKSDWSLREWFEYNRQYYEYEIIRLDVDKQDELCDLVEKYYKPSVPSVEEVSTEITMIVKGTTIELNANQRYYISAYLNRWLTERAKK